MSECVFCKIAKGEISSDKIYEGEKFLAFLDIKPNNPGHALIVPKAHYENLYKMPDEVLSEIAPLIKKLAIAVKNATHADGINIGMNNESPAGQVIPHAHFHVIPRFADDGLCHWQGKPYANKEEEIKIAEKIRATFLQT